MCNNKFILRIRLYIFLNYRPLRVRAYKNNSVTVYDCHITAVCQTVYWSISDHLLTVYLT